MTINEFSRLLGGMKLQVEVDEEGNVYIYDVDDTMLASLTKENTNWQMECPQGTLIAPSVLSLMAKFANTYIEMRKSKYIILNAMPVYEEHFIWRFFRIGEGGGYLKEYTTNDPAILINSAYTLDELEYKKAWLPKLWRNAIDSMLTPLELALEGIA